MSITTKCLQLRDAWVRDSAIPKSHAVRSGWYELQPGKSSKTRCEMGPCPMTQAPEYICMENGRLFVALARGNGSSQGARTEICYRVDTHPGLPARAPPTGAASGQDGGASHINRPPWTCGLSRCSSETHYERTPVRDVGSLLLHHMRRPHGLQDQDS